MKFRTMTPNFSVNNVAKTTSYYQNTLGFQLQMALGIDSNIAEATLEKSKEYSHAMVRRDSLYIMFVQEGVFHENIPELELFAQGASALFYIDVEKVDEVYQEFVEKKVDMVKELTTTWYGRREFYIKDCNGYILAFGEHL